MARNRPRLTYQLEMMSRDDWELQRLNGSKQN